MPFFARTRSVGLVCALALVLVGCVMSGDPMPDQIGHTMIVDDETGFTVYELRTGVGTERELAVRVVPAAGGNVCSFTVNGTELLRAPERLSDLPGVGYGIPVLYPTPNRVANGEFTFEGRKFSFPKNHGAHHIHGLVASVPWKPGRVEVTESAIRLPLSLEVREGHPVYEHFPFKHDIELTWVLEPDGLSAVVRVRNRDTRRLPFGFALHPYFRILGERSETHIMVPALRHMAASRTTKLPTGDLRPLDGLDRDLRRPVSLANLDLDDVYQGMVPERSAFFEARDVGLRVVIEASQIFTHCVVYTPRDQDFFCVESQTCSTDAHNLWSRGLADAAHLLILEPVAGPGSVVEGEVKYRVERIDPTLPNVAGRPARSEGDADADSSDRPGA